jgi:DNA-binding transcriptional LysR family regulator
MTPLPDIDLDLIRCFLTVVESGGFTQASKRLHITQSGITLKIKRLEEQLKCRLFRRTTKPPELSHEGEIVLGYARRLLDLNQEMVERVSKPKNNEALRLGVVDHFGPNCFRFGLRNSERLSRTSRSFRTLDSRMIS